MAAKAARLLKELKFGNCTERQLQIWFLGVLHHELTCRDGRYNRSRLSKSKENDDYLSVSDIEVVSDFAITLEDGSRDLSLNIIGLMRPLKKDSVSRPTNLAKELPMNKIETIDE
jgi:hypothetical protein